MFYCQVLRFNEDYHFLTLIFFFLFITQYVTGNECDQSVVKVPLCLPLGSLEINLNVN